MASDTGKTARGGKTAGTGRPKPGKSPAPEADAVVKPARDLTMESVDATTDRREPLGGTDETATGGASEPSENIFSEEPVRDPVTEKPVEPEVVSVDEVRRADPFAEKPLPASDVTPSAEQTDAAARADESEASGIGAGASVEPETAAHEPAEPAPAEPEAVVTEPLHPEPTAPESTAHAEPVRPVPPPPTPQRSGGFLGPLLGGVLAAAIGYGVAIYGWGAGLNLPFLPDRDGGAEVALNAARAEFAATAEAQSAEIAALKSELATLRDGVAPADTSAVEGRLGELAAALAEVEARLSDPAAADDEALAALSDRIAALESRPVAEGTPAEAAELAALRESLDAVQGEVSRIAAEADAAAEAAESELAARAAEAEAAARTVAVRAALAQVAAALDSGTPLAPALEALDAAGLPAPEALVAARDGVPALAQLQATFPEVARAALSDAHAAEAPADPVDRLGSFLRAQLQVRSLSPREGDDADATLSRAEAALRAGDLATAVAEVEALPEPAQPAMAGWLDDARARLAAVQAADGLAAEIDTQ